MGFVRLEENFNGITDFNFVSHRNLRDKVNAGEVAVHMKDGAPAFEITPAPPKAAKPKAPQKATGKASKAK